MIRLSFSVMLAVVAPLSAGQTDDFMRGSVVKSDKWTMDRANDREIFEGAVSFRNAAYNLKSDHAVYDRKPRTWTVKGSVYCLRKFLDGSNIELYCDNGTYRENFEQAELFRGKELIKMRYVSPEGKVLKGRCDRINSDNAKAAMDFLGNFYLETESMEIFSANGFYSDAERSFLIYGSTPIAVGIRDGRDFAMTGEKMKYFKDTGDVKLYNNVAGWVKSGEKPQEN
ncbi:MAG: hypothetical protein WCK75_04020 [Elusimicrobiota bacterium]